MKNQNSFRQINKITKEVLPRLVVAALFVLLITIPTISNANMINKFKSGFYFEKYSTAEEAKEVLLELHPIGSDVRKLVRTLDIATNREEIFDGAVDDLNKRISKKGEYIYFTHRVFLYEWNVVVLFDRNENKTLTIKNISVRRDMILP